MIKELIDKLIACAVPYVKAEARTVGAELLEATWAISRTYNDLTSLKKTVVEGVKEALNDANAQIKAQPTAQTWPIVAAELIATFVPKKIVPATMNQEILIRGSNVAPEYKKRTS